MFEGIDHIGAPTWDADRAAEFFVLADTPAAFKETIEEYGIQDVFLEFS